jgi:hypothetical protein
MGIPSMTNEKFAGNIVQTASYKTPVNMLKTLRMSLLAEMPELCFDYFSMHRRVWKVWQEMEATLFPPRKVGKSLLENNPCLPVWSLLNFAAIVESAINKVKLESLIHENGLTTTRTPLGDMMKKANANLEDGSPAHKPNDADEKTPMAPSAKEVAAMPLKQTLYHHREDVEPGWR